MAADDDNGQPDRALHFARTIHELATRIALLAGLSQAEAALGAVYFAAETTAPAMPREDFIRMCGEFYDLACEWHRSKPVQ
jgi:hypothetical protein